MVTYTRRLMLLFFDIILINLAIITALLFKFEGRIPSTYLNAFLEVSLVITLTSVLSYYAFGLYSSLWTYAGVDELGKTLFANILAGIVSFTIFNVLEIKFPRSVTLLSFVLMVCLVGLHRLSYRLFRRYKHILTYKKANLTEKNKKRALIVGAGQAGSMVIKEMKNEKADMYLPVCVVDDDRWKHRTKIHGVPVVGWTKDIKRLVGEHEIDEIVIALPSVDRKRKAEILKLCKETKCKLKTLPGIYEILDNRVTVKHIRDISIEDLLGREQVRLNTIEIAQYLKNETILVTGGGGSIGSELCRQIAKYSPKKLIVLDIYENNAYDLQNELISKYGDKLDLEVVIGSVRDKKRLEDIFSAFRPGVVFHAAAHKHVPLMEVSPTEAVKNNVFGTLNTAQCAHAFGAKKFVLISTDKAVNPTNIMGATKRMAEMIVQSMDKHSSTEFVAVRFGNVLGSNGSVIPLFKRQIAAGGPLLVTHPEITRYFMTIPEAAQLVIQAGAMAKGGEIFILDMGQPVKIVDLARDLIRLSGLEPDVDIKIEFSGLRPGEKLYEELLLEEEGLQGTKHEKIFVGKPLELSYNEVMLCVKALNNSLGDPEQVRQCMANVVPTYSGGEKVGQLVSW